MNYFKKFSLFLFTLFSGIFNFIYLVAKNPLQFSRNKKIGFAMLSPLAPTVCIYISTRFRTLVQVEKQRILQKISKQTMLFIVFKMSD